MVLQAAGLLDRCISPPLPERTATHATPVGGAATRVIRATYAHVVMYPWRDSETVLDLEGLDQPGLRGGWCCSATSGRRRRRIPPTEGA